MFQGIPVSTGIAIGHPMLYTPFVPQQWPERVPEDNSVQELDQYEAGMKTAAGELTALCARMEKDNPARAKIFSAHLEILGDVVMEQEIRTAISESFSAQEAVSRVFGTYAQAVAQAPDPLIQERSADLLDVKSRLLRCMQGEPERNLSAIDQPVILVAHDLLPSDTAALNSKKILAIVTEMGGPSSHSAIIARSYGIPAVLSAAGVVQNLRAEDLVIVDAETGTVYANPDQPLLRSYEKKREAYQRERENTRLWVTAEPRMKDGRRVQVELNIGRITKQELDGAVNVDGVGLFRTEFLYMGRDTLPGEEEQVAVYTRVLRAFSGKPVIIRTLDIGGDKKLDSMKLPTEENPFLGIRALRLCFQHPEVFLTQLRACLRASTKGDLWLMFPMVGTLNDLRRAKALLQQAREQLDERRIPYAHNVKVGIMVEIPSIALLADKVAREVDFASIGTNDLTQYTLAADRMNASVAEYNKLYQPAVFRLIGQVINAFGAVGKPVGVCGEMGGDPRAAAMLLGLGISQLSMGLSGIPGIKQLVCSLDSERAAHLAHTVCELDTAEEAETYLDEQLSDILK